MKQSGIYKITNTINGKFYIGSSINVNRRITGHKRELRNNSHRNLHLQRAYNKCGLDAFIFEILHICDSYVLKSLEQYLLNSFVGTEQCYNISIDSTSPNRGRKLKPWSPNQRLKLSVPKSADHKLRISESKKGKISYRKYTNEQREHAKHLRSLGLTYQQIADSLGCAHRTARLIVNDIYQGVVV